jgi:hypothetical protein
MGRKQVKENTEGKNLGGSPVIYDPEKTIEVLKGYIAERLSEQKAPSISHFVSVYHFEHRNDEISKHIPSRKHIYTMAENHEGLSHILEYLQIMRQSMLVENVHEGRYKEGMAKFELSARHGWKESSEQVVRNESIDPSKLNDKELNQFIELTNKAAVTSGEVPA